MMQFKKGTLRILTIGVVPVTLALLWTCPAGAQADANLSWSAKLNLKSLTDIPDRLRAPVTAENQTTPLRLTNDKASREIGSCEEYLNAVNSGFYAADNLANKISSSYVWQCYVLRDLQHARRSTSSSLYGWTKNSLSQLPPILAVGERSITDAAEAAENRGESWQQFNPALRETNLSNDELEASDGDFTYTLDILARGDFDGSGKEDVAVYGCAVGQHSTWFQCKYVVFSPTSNGKLIRLTRDAAPYRIKVQTRN